MSYLIWIYVIYAIAAIALTAILAKTLYSSGALFLESVYNDQKMASAINRLLVTGFYMLNLGYAFLIFQTNDAATALEATELLVTKLGLLLISLGIIHFINMAVFWRIKKSGDNAQYVPASPTTTMPAPNWTN